MRNAYSRMTADEYHEECMEICSMMLFDKKVSWFEDKPTKTKKGFRRVLSKEKGAKGTMIIGNVYCKTIVAGVESKWEKSSLLDLNRIRRTMRFIKE